jgi:thiamine biosynthesis lipoprotein
MATVGGWAPDRHEPPVVGDPAMAVTDPERRRAERVMGTVISMAMPEGGARSPVADAAFTWLHEVDRRFSPFRPDSEVSRLIRGDLVEDRVSDDLRDVLDLAEAVRVLSDGAFDIRGHRPDGRPDPTGLVKGWAIERAASILIAGGVPRLALNAGGDVVVRGGRATGVPWRIGVAHPDGRSTALVLEADDLAVATSGRLERGEHIRDARTGAQAPPDLVSITVAGPSLARADGYATGAFAMGEAGMRWTLGLPGYGAAAITVDGRMVTTPTLRTWRRRDPDA